MIGRYATRTYATRTEFVQIMPDELDDGVGIHIGIDDPFHDGPMVVIKQGEEEIHLPAELWARFVEEASAVVANGVALLGAAEEAP